MARAKTAKESALVNKLLPILNMLPRAKAIKRHGSAYARAGEPDIDACIDGRSVQIECKRKDEESSPLQVKRQDEWEAAGAMVVRDAVTLDDVRFAITNPMTGLLHHQKWDRAVEMADEAERKKRTGRKRAHRVQDAV